MKTKKFFSLIILGIGLSLSSCCHDHYCEDPWRYEDDYIDITTRYTLNGEVSTFAERDFDYLILGTSQENTFITISLANEGRYNASPNIQVRTLLPLDELAEEIDFLNQTSPYHFDNTVEPCFYEGDVYWQVSCNVRGIYGLINHFGKSYIVETDFYYNENIHYEFLSEIGFHFWTPFSKNYYLRLRSQK